jgi:uncharacterized damage-inducible protein DinB
MLEYFKRLFEYEFWATERVLDALKNIDPKANEKLFKTASHVLVANQVWLYRLLKRLPANLDRVLDLKECNALFVTSKEEWKKYLSGLSEVQMGDKIAYENSKGTHYENALPDILAHIVNHGSYHRGQIASLVKQAGGDPVNTDFIGFVRQ